MDKIDFSLILACYNEGSTLPKSLERIKEVLDNTRYTWEIICINDASKDNTLKEIQEFAKNRPNIKVFNHIINVGRGGTVAEGIFQSQGRVAGFIDVDLEVSPVYIPEFIRAIDKGIDIAMGNRIELGGLSAFTRWVASKAYISLVHLLLGLPFKDTETGYKFFNRKKILPVLKETENKKWFFDTEIIARSHYKKLKIKEIPVLYIRRPEKQSTINLIPDSLEYLKSILMFRAKML